MITVKGVELMLRIIKKSVLRFNYERISYNLSFFFLFFYRFMSRRIFFTARYPAGVNGEIFGTTVSRFEPAIF